MAVHGRTWPSWPQSITPTTPTTPFTWNSFCTIYEDEWFLSARFPLATDPILGQTLGTNPSRRIHEFFATNELEKFESN